MTSDIGARQGASADAVEHHHGHSARTGDPAGPFVWP